MKVLALTVGALGIAVVACGAAPGQEPKEDAPAEGDAGTTSEAITTCPRSLTAGLSVSGSGGWFVNPSSVYVTNDGSDAIPVLQMMFCSYSGSFTSTTATTSAPAGTPSCQASAYSTGFDCFHYIGCGATTCSYDAQTHVDCPTIKLGTAWNPPYPAGPLDNNGNFPIASVSVSGQTLSCSYWGTGEYLMIAPWG